MDGIKKSFYATFKEKDGYEIKRYDTQSFSGSDVITIIITYAADIKVSIDIEWDTGDIRNIDGEVYYPKLLELQENLHDYIKV